MKRILITGGSGFLGGHLIDQAKKKFTVVATYFKHRYDTAGVQWKYLDFTKIDSLESFVDSIQPQVIIHTAAMTQVDECEKNRELAYLINVRASEQLARIAANRDIRFIYISSDMVYDGEKGRYTEDDPENPINYYGKTKVMAEEKIAAICTDYVVARAALIYGTPLTNSNSFSEKILENISQQRKVKLFYDQYRTPILVNNLAEALLELALLDYTGKLNLGGSERINRYDFGLKMAAAYNFSPEWFEKYSMYNFTTSAKRPQDVSLNISRAQQLLTTKLVDCSTGLALSSANSCNSITNR